MPSTSCSDAEVMRYLDNGRARTREEVEKLHRGRLEAARRVPGLGFWAGFVDDEFVGWWILQPPERADQWPGRRTGRARIPDPAPLLAQRLGE